MISSAILEEGAAANRGSEAEAESCRMSPADPSSPCHRRVDVFGPSAPQLWGGGVGREKRRPPDVRQNFLVCEQIFEAIAYVAA